jgi:hypothetical protein
VVALLLAAAPAWGQSASTGIVADRFVPGLGPETLLAGESTLVTPPLQLVWGVSLGYLRDPILLSGRFTGAEISRPVRGALVSDFSAEFGLGAHLAAGVGMPVVWTQSGDRLRNTGVDDKALASPVGGDLRLRVKGSLLAARSIVGAAAIVQFTVPTGGQHDFAATSTVSVEPRVLVDLHLRRLLLVAELGVRFAGERKLFLTSFGDEFTWVFGAKLGLVDRPQFGLHAVAEFAGFVGPSDGTRPTEARGGLGVAIGPLLVDLGAGGGITSDVAAPSWRVLAVVRGLFFAHGARLR